MLRTVLLIVTLFLPSLLACRDTEDRPVAPAEDNGKTFGSVTDLVIDNRQFSYNLATGAGPRTITTQRRGQALISTMRDGNGQLLVELIVEFDDNSVILSEATATDRLWIKRTETTDEVMEQFVFNGRELIVSYPKLDQISMRKSFTQYQQGNYGAIHPELLEAFIAFEEFYDMDNSLQWNADGEILVSSLLSRELSDKIAGVAVKQPKYDNPPLRPLHKAVDIYCGVVGVGTSIKCWIGGLGNFLCVAGSIVSFSCALLQIACAVWTC